MNPVPIHEDYTLLDGVKGCGQILGTVIGIRGLSKELGWNGEGEVKFFIDGETNPTICGTGTEDYVGFAWGLSEMCTPLQGCPLFDKEAGLYSIYRLHTRDPICFEKNIKITIQQIGFGSGAAAKEFFGSDFKKHKVISRDFEDDLCYYDLSEDICSVVYWYQTLPGVEFPVLPDREARIADLIL